MVLTHIIHISDIHIRHGDRHLSRYDEYDEVFTNLFQSIKSEINKRSLTHDQFIIVLTGDIFHNKNVIGNYGLTLYKKLIENLTSINRTIMFHGNHDRNQNEINQPSLISSTMNIHNLTILDCTQSFIIDKIGFSYVNIDDTLDELKTCGRIEDLPPFPEIRDNVDYKVALFHGTFANVKLNNGLTASEHPYPFEWIQNFDYALLGDIHLRQKGTYEGTYDNKTLWGYAGSLVQQNYGEEIINHGYMIWDLYNKSVTDINVYNPKGYVYLKYTDCISIKIRSDYVPLYTIIESPYFPKHIDIKLHSDVDLSLLDHYNIKYNVINTIQYHENNHNIEHQHNDIDDKSILEYFSKHLTSEQYTYLINLMKTPEQILLDENQFPDDMRNECKKKNRDLQLLVNHCLQSKHKSSTRFKINYLEFSNLYCYKGTNWIDFTKAAHNIFLMAGNNGTGKSAIYDILVLAIWGNITIEKRDSELSGSIINHKKQNASSTIELEKDNVIYKICRKYNIKNEFKCNKSHIMLYESNNLIAKDNACSSKILELFGTLNDFLSSSMVTQNVDADILKMDHKECLSLIDNIFNIDHLHNKFELFKTASKRYKDFKKTIIDKKDVYDKLFTQCDDDINITNLENQKKILSSEKQKYQIEYDSILVDINDNNISLIDDVTINKYENINIQDDYEYEVACNKYNEIKIQLKHLTDKEVINLKKLYKHQSIPDPINKPCEYRLIKDEEEALAKYMHLLHKTGIINDQVDNENQYSNLILQLKQHNDNKPVNCPKPKHMYNNVLESINTIYDTDDSIVCLHHFCNTNNRIATTEYNNDNLSYTEYLSAVKQKEEHTSIIKKLQEELISFALSTDNLQSKRPDTPINITTAKAVRDVLTKYTDIDIKMHIMDNFYQKQDEITSLHKQLNEYLTEQRCFTTDEYQYNPRCKYCCKRPWVLRKQELEILIDNIRTQIMTIESELYYQSDHVYLELYQAIEEYNIYQEWLQYLEYKEANEQKQLLISRIKSSENVINKSDQIITQFNIISFQLFDNYKYKQYQDWKCIYDILNTEINELQENMMLPRLKRLLELKSMYAKWSEYDHMCMIKSAYDLHKIASDINDYKKKIEYNEFRAKQPLIKRKLILQNQLKDINNQIQTINHTITKHNTIVEQNHKHKALSDMLYTALNSINTTIDIMDIVIAKFKEYKKYLYESYILKSLTQAANKHIKSLCHHNTKHFEVGYLLTDSNGNIHINWLVNTGIEQSDVAGIKSVKQASGFQQFAISLALRMALFENRQCQQLFIDEGFTACDKQNLSIVPSFLKQLLRTFHTVVLVSHIDIIQDNVDNIAHIHYDKATNNSKITYGIRKL